jgi:ferrous iron transport protein B
MQESATKAKPSSLAHSRRISVGLAGNPNSGKTTIFNNLTGARQHVGNYPGVTVEKKEGRFRHQEREVTLTDLPGTYSLTAYSIEELVARRFVIEEKPDVVVDVVDASNLERNLYLAVQFMELGIPLVLAFNMSDLARTRGIEIDIENLSRLLGVAIVPTVGHKGEGMDALKDAILAAADKPENHRPAHVTYGREVEAEVRSLAGLIDQDGGLEGEVPARWLAVKLLESDEEAHKQLASLRNPDKVADAARTAAHHIERDFGDTAETLIADRRYGFISGACQEAVKTTVQSRQDTSDRIDSVVTSRLLGIPIFLGMMYLVFKLTFTLGDPFMGWIEGGFEWLGGFVSSWWAEGSESALQSLLVDGLIGGVGGVIVFLPNILLLFLAIAILEDSGYMARAAFIMDRLMHKIGLHGKSFIPMLIGFGCTVPAIMGTRTLENRRDRLATMLVLPLMSCGARLPIYALFIPAFFPQAWQAPVLWLIYIVGIFLAILMAKLLRVTILKGETAPFVMELPPYRMPTLKGAFIHMWERGWMFLRKAGTVIVGISIILWALTSYPKPPESALEGLTEEQAQNAALSYSVAGRIGHALEPVMRPIGFDWKTNTAMIGAFAAKEVFVAQLGIVHSLGEADEESEPLREVLKREYTPLQALSIMLFCLISVPCMVTVATTWKESGSWKWAALQVFGLTALAYVISLSVYQIGLRLG